MSAPTRRRVDRLFRAWSVASLIFWVALLAAAIATATNVQAATSGVPGGVGDEPVRADFEQRRSEPQTTVDEVSSNVMCPSCDSTLDQSSSPAAQRMRAWVERAVAAGWTEQEIREGLVTEYGGDESVLAVPRAAGLGLGIWIVPAIVVLGALLGAVVILRRWKGDSRAARAASSGTGWKQPPG